MKDVRELLDTFTDHEWEQAKKEMTKRIPSLSIELWTMGEFQALATYLASPDLMNIDDTRRKIH